MSMAYSGGQGAHERMVTVAELQSQASKMQFQNFRILILDTIKSLNMIKYDQKLLYSVEEINKQEKSSSSFHLFAGFTYQFYQFLEDEVFLVLCSFSL